MNAVPIDPSAMVDTLVNDEGGPPVSNAEGSSMFFKHCSRCGHMLPLSAFNKDKSRSDGRSRYCRSCRKQIRSYYHDVRPELARATNARWRKRHPGRAAEFVRSWLSRHPEHRISQRPKDAKRQREHPKEHCARQARRRARKRQAAGSSYTTVQHIKWRWEMWGNKYWICNAPASCTDHVISLARGGSHWPANLRPCCTPCNSRKGDRPFQKGKAHSE